MSESNEPTFKPLRLMDNINEPSSSFLCDQRTDDQQPDKSQVQVQRNSLCRLNDFSLRDIFNRVDRETLCQLADVSTRLRTIAEKSFPKGYTQKYLGPHQLFRRSLCKFGQLITRIDCRDDYCPQKRIDAIIKYCPNLEILRIKVESNLELVANSFPKLVELVINDPHCDIDTFRKLILVSSQLKRLQIWEMATDDHITVIAQHAKNLEELEIQYPFPESRLRLTREGLLQLIELKKLKRFHYNRFKWIDFLAPLMIGFARENVNLNYLHLEGFSILAHQVESISRLKQIEYLYLGRIKCVPYDITLLVRKLPLLSTLGLRFHNDFNWVSVGDLINLVKDGKQLHKIQLLHEDIEVDQKNFEDLLEAASNRLKQETLIIYLGKSATVIVPLDIQDENRDKLQIKFRNC